jgi:hypothetical protein
MKMQGKIDANDINGIFQPIAKIIEIIDSYGVEFSVVVDNLAELNGDASTAKCQIDGIKPTIFYMRGVEAHKVYHELQHIKHTFLDEEITIYPSKIASHSDRILIGELDNDIQHLAFLVDEIDKYAKSNLYWEGIILENIVGLKFDDIGIRPYELIDLCTAAIYNNILHSDIVGKKVAMLAAKCGKEKEVEELKMVSYERCGTKGVVSLLSAICGVPSKASLTYKRFSKKDKAMQITL